MSDIRVSVQWKNPTVFAGEDIECTITFKNIALAPSTHRSSSPNPHTASHGSHRELWKEALPVPSANASTSAIHRKSPSLSGFSQSQARTHKQALSLNSANNSPKSPIVGFHEGTSKTSTPGDNKHRRSVSIVSIRGDANDETSPHSHLLNSGRSSHGHTRAASLHVMPRRNGLLSNGPSSASGNERAFTMPSPLFRASTSYAEQRFGLQSIPHPKHQVVSGVGLASPVTGTRDHSSYPSFRFPHVSVPISEVSGRALRVRNEQSPNPIRRALSPRPQDVSNGLDQINPATRILSPSSINGTPRSSGEFYSMSNNSTETLASEYIPRGKGRLVHRPAHSRHVSNLAPAKASKPEVLMMGYGQIIGSFTLDGSLVNQGPFEEVKRKGIVGGQGGGGVVRNISTKRESGLLGSIGWGNIGGSLGGLLGGTELSSIKESNDSPSARLIPIISTPQSILFVDLQLGPGESKSYTYSHPLPKGIPPSYKGRAMKISYNLVVGTQRAANTTQQHQVQRADIPFRILPGVNGHGQILGHDLMSPHTILQNTASISSVDNAPRRAVAIPGDPSQLKVSNSSPTEFLSYVGRILDTRHLESGLGLLSPTEIDSRSHTPMSEEPSTMRESIDLAILRSNVATSSNRSANRFEIARSGERVAVILLTRPAYRLGEAVPVVIDFHESDVSCYSLHATLETSETIDPAIALRSKASIQRVTRRIYASQFESTISARQVLFSPMIPAASTPEFITSGINLEWKLRFEFVTSRLGDAEELEEGIDGLMEEVAKDERGSVQAAVQGLSCETFDVTVPLRVYGATVGFDEKTEAGDFSI